MKTKAEYLAHLVFMAQRDKRYAWWAAKNYAEMNPEHADLPQLLTEAMRQQSSKS